MTRKDCSYILTLNIHQQTIRLPKHRKNGASKTFLVAISVKYQHIQRQEGFGADGTFVKLIFVCEVILLMGAQLTEVKEWFGAMKTSINGILRLGRNGVLGKGVGRTDGEIGHVRGFYRLSVSNNS